MMNYKPRKSKRSRINTILVAIAVIVVVVAALALYPRAPTVNTVYCGVLEYVVFPAQSVTGSRTFNVTQTMTTAIDYTTTTVPGPLGKTYSNSTITTNSGVYSAGVETICKYISITSTSTKS